MNSKHPYEPFIPEGATKLIIGSIPPPRFCKVVPELRGKDVNFYYGSEDNHFWCLLTKVFGEEFLYANNEHAVSQRKDFLKRHGFGITDIIMECEHPEGSASDEKLGKVSYRNILQLLTDHPSIKTLLYTSAFVKKQINSYFYQQKLAPLPYHATISKDDKAVQSLKLGKREPYQVKILYSPSPQGLRNLGPDGEQKRIDQYKLFLA